MALVARESSGHVVDEWFDLEGEVDTEMICGVVDTFCLILHYSNYGHHESPFDKKNG